MEQCRVQLAAGKHECLRRGYHNRRLSRGQQKASIVLGHVRSPQSPETIFHPSQRQHSLCCRLTGTGVPREELGATTLVCGGDKSSVLVHPAESLEQYSEGIVPSLALLQASRAQILDKATEYIQYMRRKNHTHQQDIDDLKRQNALLEQQVRALEKARSSAQLQANYPSSDNSLYTNPKGSTISAFDGGSDSSSDSEPDEPQSRKKLRMEAS
ncbi:protein max isoform X1 [Apteryx mantelli]|uniref:Protein max isoform X1 n=1 Tax=Apteryx mantelli TaxID=2696672 RepID=A0ABM4EGZ1_9AVES|nr:protein max [Apteryx rowi]